MIVIGAVLVIVCFLFMVVVIISCVESYYDTPDFIMIFVCVFLIVFGGWLICQDVLSPVETTEKTIYTTDYQAYDLNFTSDKLGKIKITRTEATRAGAIFNDVTKYEFVEFAE